MGGKAEMRLVFKDEEDTNPVVIFLGGGAQSSLGSATSQPNEVQVKGEPDNGTKSNAAAKDDAHEETTG